MKTLSGLLQREISFDLDGESFPVKLLPILFFGDYKKILEDTEKELSSRNIAEGRIRLRSLILHVWPEKKKDLLFHFDYNGLCNVARVLFFGEDYLYRKQKTPAGKNEKGTEEIDLALMAGRIMHHFPSFDLEKLSMLPLPVFLKLDNLASRIQADNALSLYIPSIAAGMGSEGIVPALEKTRNDTGNTPSSNKQTYSQEELEKAIVKMKTPGKVIKEIKAGMHLME